MHLPGHAEFDAERAFQHLEKRYFEPGDLGFPVWRTMGGIFGMCICNDRRWPETYRVMGLQGVEMVVLGYNTPSVNSQKAEEGPEKRLFHHNLSVQAGAYQNSTFVIATAKCGVEDGHPLFGGSCIVNPDGEIVATAKTEDDELVVAAIDLDDTRFNKETIFDFERHRRIEHYGRITSQTGVMLPPEMSVHDQGSTLSTILAAIRAADRYKLLISLVIPRPIALVTTLGPTGIVNAAPFSFFNMFSESPPLCVLGLQSPPDGGMKDTPAHIRERGAFVVNLVDEALGEQMNIVPSISRPRSARSMPPGSPCCRQMSRCRALPRRRPRSNAATTRR